MDVEVDVDIDACLGSFKGVSKSVHALLNRIEAAMALTFIILKQRLLSGIVLKTYGVSNYHLRYIP